MEYKCVLYCTAGSSCRIRVHRLKQVYSTPEEAELQLQAEVNRIENYDEVNPQAEVGQIESDSRDVEVQFQAEVSQSGSSNANQVPSTPSVYTTPPPYTEYSMMGGCEDLLHKLLVDCCAAKGIVVPSDFGALLLHAMEYLHKNERSNIFYSLAKGIGMMRDDGSDSRFPVKRMPFGLLEYMAKFFSSDTFQQVIMILYGGGTCSYIHCR